MELDFILRQALEEDIGKGDFSSIASIPANARGIGKLISKDTGILAGEELAGIIFGIVDPSIKLEKKSVEGQEIFPGTVICVAEGNLQSLLKVERLVLNYMQRMSGIATMTRKFTQAVKHTQAKILDTRKTTPLFRYFEKWAVRIGGGLNHRMGLYDMIMLKDNHIDSCGGISNAIVRAKDFITSNRLVLKIEIETRNLKEVEEVLRTGHVDRIMLDNFSVPDLITAVKIIGRKYETEASGGITLENVVPIAETGVDFISAGCLTHSYKSLDLHLKIKSV